MQQVTAFVHGHEAEGWHSFNMRDTMSALQWDKIPGYTGHDTLLDSMHAFCRLLLITNVGSHKHSEKLTYPKVEGNISVCIHLLPDLVLISNQAAWNGYGAREAVRDQVAD